MDNRQIIMVGVAMAGVALVVYLLSKGKKKEHFGGGGSHSGGGHSGHGGGGGHSGGHGGGWHSGHGGHGGGWPWRRHGYLSGWNGYPMDYWYYPSTVVGSIYPYCYCDDYYYSDIQNGLSIDKALDNLKVCKIKYGC